MLVLASFFKNNWIWLFLPLILFEVIFIVIAFIKGRNEKD